MTKVLLGLLLLFMSTSPSFAFAGDDLANQKLALEAFFAKLEGNAWVSEGSSERYEREADGDWHKTGVIFFKDEHGHQTMEGLNYTFRIENGNLLSITVGPNGEEIANKQKIVSILPNYLELRSDSPNGYWMYSDEFENNDTFVRSFSYFQRNPDGTYFSSGTKRMIFKREI